MTSAYSDPAPVTVRVPAKVNLELLVGPARDDGFHTLSTVYQAVSLHDDVTVALDDDWGCSVNGPYADVVPSGAANLALRAARLLADETAIDTPVHVSIVKSIPVAGGMAGGSADAAATLVACDRLLRARSERWVLVASAVGTAVCYVPWLLAPSPLVSTVLMLPVGACAAPLYPLAAAQAYARRPEASGAVLAAGQLFTPLGLALPFAIGLVADHAGTALALALLVAQPLGLVVLVAATRVRR